MVSSIIARKCIKNGAQEQVNLSLRLATPTLKNAIALNITIDSDRWTMVNKSLKLYAKAYRQGADIMIDDSLKLKLWNLLKAIEVRFEADRLTLESARQAVKDVLHEEMAKEAAAIEAAIMPPECTEKRKKERMTLMEFFREYIRQCETGERLKRKSTQMISPGTIKSTKGTLTQLEEYERVRHRRLDFDDMTLDFYDDLKRFFIKKQYSPNTIGRHVKNLKTILFAAEDMKLTTTTDFKSGRFSVDHEDVENVYITEERLDEMAAFDMSDYRTMKERAERFAKDDEEKFCLIHALRRDIYRKNLGIARDIFVVGCLTGQRVSDYKRISGEMIEQLRDGRQYIRIVQEKTGKEVFLPLDARVPEILAKYGDKLPKIQDQHLNYRIKVVGLLLGWTEPAGLHERRGSLTYKSHKRFCDALKTHTARRSFATNAYKAGVSLASIMAVTGHSSEAMLRKYLKLDNKERAILAAAEFEKLRKAE